MIKRIVTQPNSIVSSGLGRFAHEKSASIITAHSDIFNGGLQGDIRRVSELDGQRHAHYLVKQFRSGFPPGLIGILKALASGANRSHATRIQAFKGLPLFAFDATADGVPFSGYVMREVPGESFSGILEQKIDHYVSQPLSLRLGLARQFCEGAAALFAMTAQHNDLNPSNIQIDLSTGSLAILDIDGGGLARDGVLAPVLGKMQSGWLAPEIYHTLAANAGRCPSAAVRISADMYNVAVMVHALLFGMTPFFFVMNAPDIPRYLAQNRWPDVASVAGIPLINRQAKRFHKNELTKVASLKPLFEAAFQEGYSDPVRRPSPAEWLLAVKNSLANLNYVPRQTHARPVPANSLQRGVLPRVQQRPAAIHRADSLSPPTTVPPAVRPQVIPAAVHVPQPAIAGCAPAATANTAPGIMNWWRDAYEAIVDSFTSAIQAVVKAILAFFVSVFIFLFSIFIGCIMLFFFVCQVAC